MPDSLSGKHCLLCASTHLKVKDSLASALLVEGYAKTFSVNVESHFKAGGNVNLTECADCGLLAYDPMPAGDAAFYEALQKLPWYYQDIKPEYHFAKTHVGARDRVLEVGCGKGVFRSFIADSVDYRGLEFNQVAIDKARASGLNVTAEPIHDHADAHPGEYDVVCHFQVLEHVSDPRGFLLACTKAIKPGGKLIVAVPAEDSFLSLCESGWLNMPPHHVTRWHDGTLRHTFETQLGFTIDDVWHEPVAEYHRDWHQNILVNYAVKNLLGQNICLASETTFTSKIARRLSAYDPIRHWLLAKAEQRFPFSKRGHTVCVVSSAPHLVAGPLSA